MKESAVSFCHPTSRSAFATRCVVFVHPVFDTPYLKPLDDTGVALDEVIAGQRFSIDLVSAIAVEAVGCRVRCDGDARLPCDTASVTDCARSSKTSSGQAISGAKPPSSPGHQIAVGHYRPQRAVDLRTCTNHFRQGRCPDRRDHELLEIQGALVTVAHFDGLPTAGRSTRGYAGANPAAIRQCRRHGQRRAAARIEDLDCRY